MGEGEAGLPGHWGFGKRECRLREFSFSTSAGVGSVTVAWPGWLHREAVSPEIIVQEVQGAR